MALLPDRLRDGTAAFGLVLRNPRLRSGRARPPRLGDRPVGDHGCACRDRLPAVGRRGRSGCSASAGSFRPRSPARSRPGSSGGSAATGCCSSPGILRTVAIGAAGLVLLEGAKPRPGVRARRPRVAALDDGQAAADLGASVPCPDPERADRREPHPHDDRELGDAARPDPERCAALDLELGRGAACRPRSPTSSRPCSSHASRRGSHRPPGPGVGDAFADTLAGLRTINADPRLRLIVEPVLRREPRGRLAERARSGLGPAAAQPRKLGSRDPQRRDRRGRGARAPIVAAALLGRRRIATDLGLGLVLCGLPIILVAAIPRTALTLVLLAMLGIGVTIVDFSAVTLLQRAIPDNVLARVFSLLQSVFVGTIGLGALLAPLLVSWLGIRGALVSSGDGPAAADRCALAAPRPARRGLPRRPTTRSSCSAFDPDLRAARPADARAARARARSRSPSRRARS